MNIMGPLTLYGNPSTWLAIGLTWLVGGLVIGILFGLVATVERRVARLRERREVKGGHPQSGSNGAAITGNNGHL